ncbi:hypothetical protein NLJ89_g8623 [Agrocybe chaxingu]|uniref:Uncharacterized protein n=1 Tax=Agrocybe chaxingu TaxID=84603 RepID=A0A9W8K1H0_9AGAR|nr:hypothetical protein NLJ89_g8623 [Agrocybe chaxingu]
MQIQCLGEADDEGDNEVEYEKGRYQSRRQSRITAWFNPLRRQPNNTSPNGVQEYRRGVIAGATFVGNSVRMAVNRLTRGRRGHNNTLPPSADATTPCSTLYPKCNNPERSRIKDLIRKHIAKLLPDRELDPSSCATPEELTEFHFRWVESRRRPLCCGVHNFKIDLFGTPHSSWNTSAALVFAKDFMEGKPIDVDVSEGEVQTMYFERIKVLRLEFLRTERGEEAVKAFELRQRRNSRKTSLWHDRLRGGEGNVHLRKHVAQLRRGSPALMSSNESQDEGGTAFLYRHKKYIVLRPVFRAPSLDGWLHMFDTVRDIDFRMRAPRGSPIRLRVRVANRKSTSEGFPHGLQINTYCNNWLSTRADIDNQVGPTYDHYDYSHSNDLLEYLRRHSQQQTVTNAVAVGQQR